MNVTLRQATTNDVSAIHAIRNYYIAHSNATVNIHERTLSQTQTWFESIVQTLPFWIAEKEGEVVAYAALSTFRAQDGYAQTAEVSVYVHHEHTHGGIGGALLAKLCAVAAGYGLHCLVAVITAENTKSVALHEKHGFAISGTFPQLARKNNAYLDVVFMHKLLESN